MTDTNAHAVQFRGDHNSWLDGITSALNRAVRRGDTVASVLTASNRDALAVRMRERGWNLAELEERGRYLVFDAEETATQVMRGSIVDSDAIAGMDAALQSARTASGASHLTIVGEIAPFSGVAAALTRRWRSSDSGPN